MKKTLAIVAVALFVAAPAFGANLATIAYTLQAGGNNGGTWAGDPTPPPLFDASGVTAAPGTYTTAANIVTWSVNVAVGGTYGPDGSETPVYGAANLVWDLALKDSTGTLVALGHGSPTTPGFFSNIQNGVKLYGGNVLTEENAAFPWVFDPYGTGSTHRIFDTGLDGGPGMLQYTYPNTAAFKAGSTAPSGTLKGMGAGYKDFAAPGNTLTGVAGGVGIAGGGSCSQDIGTLPIAEGQINMTGLPNGTYTLELTPGKGNNVVWYDMTMGICETGSTGAFAVAVPSANITAPALTIVRAVVVPPALVSAVSNRVHGTVGTFGLPMALSGTAGVECRQGGPQSVVFTYDKAMTGTPVVTATAVGGAAPAVTPPGPMSGTSFTVALSGAVDKTCITLTVSGITAADGSGAPAQNAIKITYRLADVDYTHSVGATDIALVKSKSSFSNVTAANFWYDLDCTGKTGNSDIAIVKSKSAFGSTTCNY